MPTTRHAPPVVPANRDELLARFATTGGQSRDDRIRAHHREQIVAGAVNGGRDPRDYADDEVLARFFTADELALLDAAVAEHERARDNRANATAMLEVMRAERAKVDRELAAWAEAVIEAETRKRLGWPATGYPKAKPPGDDD